MGAISPPAQIPRLAFRALLATPGHARRLQRRDEHPGPPRRYADCPARQEPALSAAKGQRWQKPLRRRLAVLESTLGPRPAETATGGQVVKAAERPLCPMWATLRGRGHLGSTSPGRQPEQQPLCQPGAAPRSLPRPSTRQTVSMTQTHVLKSRMR